MLIFSGAFIMVFVAELGDKSQLLAMALATRYSVKKVLAGVVLATLLNNGLAVFAGYYLRASLNLEIMQLAASSSFIVFGLWKLYEESGEKEALQVDTPAAAKKTGTAINPVITSAGALFLAEMGDKTQLATISYVVKYGAPFLTLLGVVAGMVLADALGIFTGNYLSRLLSPALVRRLAALVFILIGLSGLLSYFGALPFAVL